MKFGIFFNCKKQNINKKLKITIIGLGSGIGYDGQFLYIEDFLGMHDRYYPKYYKRYINFLNDSIEAIKSFIHEVNSEIFSKKLIILKLVNINIINF